MMHIYILENKDFKGDLNSTNIDTLNIRMIFFDNKIFIDQSKHKMIK